MSKVEQTLPYRQLFNESILSVIDGKLNDQQHSISTKDFHIKIRDIVEAFDLEIVEENLGYDISGCLEGNKIIVNKNHSENRKRFTIAHEFAHFILNHDGTNLRTIDKSNYKNPVDYSNEIAANSFAASILMPEIQVETLYDTFLKINNLDQNTNLTSEQKRKLYEYVSEKLKVSESAASYRLINLGLI